MINIKNARRHCRDDISKIENYDKAMADTKHTWHCHHRLELTLDGDFANSREDLKRFGMYYKRPYFELIFLPQSIHRKIHNHNGMSQETKKKLKTATTGERNGMYGKHPSEETKLKMRGVRGECFKGNVHWMTRHLGDNNVSRRDDVRQKIADMANARYHYNATHQTHWKELTKLEKQEYCDWYKNR